LHVFHEAAANLFRKLRLFRADMVAARRSIVDLTVNGGKRTVVVFRVVVEVLLF
jgi:hypothetical protein